jgi:membrane-associated progesterone receptor component
LRHRAAPRRRSRWRRSCGCTTAPTHPIRSYISIRGKVYYVSSGRSFYGPGGAYAIFAGNEASRSLSMMSKDETDVSDDLSGLTEKELSVIAD